ncbi:GDP-L-fucose synthase [Ferruginibacter lapsinanis]|uniref:GDP-L-fucose synthase family protein n=1 Tax=Ferruginibacter lapsinanis TaxID=563172 RepID=UPI001E423857|nr:GDP-L-fucose synthase [Ferruginibacter lapsinanis]UEG49479.1 GDP-L-fucose synthase [Ferruginibacter lapsinanis]
MNNTDKIYVAGHNGLVGSAIVRLLKSKGHTNILTRTSAELDLRNQVSVKEFFAKEKPQYVFMAAAKVGGIWANKTYPAEFIFDNLSIQNNVIHEAYKNGVTKLLFLGSSCIYPKNAPQPIIEDYLLTDSLEPTNEAYAIAKIAGIKMCQAYHQQYGCNFISVMPTNLYGPGDNYDLQKSHVLPALIRKFHEAKMNNDEHVTIWGTGKPSREFLHADDAAAACYFLMQNYDQPEIINIGWGKDDTIAELALQIKETVGFTGKLIFDDTKPDGTMRKLLNVDKLNALGWSASINLKEGIQNTYQDFTSKYDYYTSKK